MCTLVTHTPMPLSCHSQFQIHLSPVRELVVWLSDGRHWLRVQKQKGGAKDGERMRQMLEVVGIMCCQEGLRMSHKFQNLATPSPTWLPFCAGPKIFLFFGPEKQLLFLQRIPSVLPTNLNLHTLHQQHTNKNHTNKPSSNMPSSKRSSPSSQPPTNYSG